MKCYLSFLIIGVIVPTGCAAPSKTRGPEQNGWRAYATPDMLRLYDEFASPVQGGRPWKVGPGWVEYLLPDGVKRLVYDQDGDGRPESVSDDLPDETLVTAIDSDEDGRVEILLREAGSTWRFEDKNYNGTFDSFRSEFAEGTMFRVRVYADPDEDGHFEEVETWLRPDAQPTLKK